MTAETVPDASGPLRAVRRAVRARGAGRRAGRARPRRTRTARPTRRSPASWTGCCARTSGRPTPLTDAARLTAHAGGARILLKREDLAHTGSHKLNNALGQALLTKRMGKTRVIAETGAGQHGVATATACAYLGLECVVYMGEEDTVRQALNVARMRMLGAEVVAGDDRHPDAQGRDHRGDAGLGDQRRDHPLRDRLGDGAAPVPDAGARLPAGDRRRGPRAAARADRPAAGRGDRLRRRRLQRDGDLHRVRAGRRASRLVGYEAGGSRRRGRAARGDASPAGRPGVLHGMRTYLLQDPDGQTLPTALGVGRAGLPGRRPGARLAVRHRPGLVPVGDRRAGDGGAAAARAHRGHPLRDRDRARRARRGRAGPRAGAGRRSCWSACPAAATRTWTPPPAGSTCSTRGPPGERPRTRRDHRERSGPGGGP